MTSQSIPSIDGKIAKFASQILANDPSLKNKMAGRKGKQLETQARKFLSEQFRTDLVFKLVNTERMDFIVIDSGGTVNIVEAKQTKDHYYNPKSKPKKREQLEHYFAILGELRTLVGQEQSAFWMLVRLRGKLVFNKYENMAEIPTHIEA